MEPTGRTIKTTNTDSTLRPGSPNLQPPDLEAATKKKQWGDDLYTPPRELHACMGLNACQGHGYKGDNACAGMGDCATQQHYCHTLNDCRGQGGCGLYGSSEEVCTPGQNDCAFQGSCGTPIPASRYVTQGPNKGESVWQIARRLFETRMTDARRTFGDSPMRYGPTLKYLKDTYGSGASCGYSGAKRCSFVSDDEAKARALAYVESSAKNLPQSMANCNEGDDCC